MADDLNDVTAELLAGVGDAVKEDFSSVLTPTEQPTARVPMRPRPESELTPEQREIRELKDRLAKAEARKLEEEPETMEVQVVAAGDYAAGDTILIHFVEDGFTALGRVWYRGQELEFDRNGDAYEQTKDRNGWSWLSLTEMDQARKYGKTYFRFGPWPGDTYADTPEGREAAAIERARRRAAPVMTSLGG